MVTATATFAFDKKSARSFDADGRMRVRDCVISVAEINPYYGKEIPGRDALSLDANAVYDLYRDPVEMERAAPTFNGLPLMIRHIAQTADNPRKEYIGGSVGNTRFKDGKWIADLMVWDQQAIDYIESEELADLSCSYRYTPDMTPVEVDGRKAHGSMRNIEGNHVALVEDGRATGAHVADSALSSQPGATTVSDTDTREDKILHMLEAIDNRLQALEGGRANDADKDADKANDSDKDDDKDDDSDKGDDKANDESEEKAKKDEREGEKRSEKDRKDEREGEERAMDAKSVQAVVDAAVKAERKRAEAVTAAKQACRADLGDMIAMDDAGEIYRAALKQRGVDVSAIPTGAEQATYQAIQSVGRPGPSSYANDSRSDGKPSALAEMTARFGKR